MSTTVKIILAVVGAGAVLVVGVAITLLVVLASPEKGVRFQAYAGECTMTVTYATGPGPGVVARDVRGPRVSRGNFISEWHSDELEVASGTKVTMKAVASPCSSLVGLPTCTIRHRDRKLVENAPTRAGECSAEAVIP